MHIESLREYCLLKKGVDEGFPFDNNTLVFKVMGKMFALTGIDPGDKVNLKCDPAIALELREQYPEIQPGYHMNKQHWNTVRLDGSLEESLLKRMIDDSYQLVVDSLPKKDRLLLSEL
jgi:predicted DNA-binding protein (MmcQ/YjbR family)